MNVFIPKKLQKKNKMLSKSNEELFPFDTQLLLCTLCPLILMNVYVHMTGHT